MFRFRLETILTQRRHVEERFQKELADTRQEFAAAQAVLREAKDTHRRCMGDMRRKQRDRFRADDMLLYYPYLERLKLDIELHMKRVAAVERKVEQKRQALLEAVKKRKILDKREGSSRRTKAEAGASSGSPTNLPPARPILTPHFLDHGKFYQYGKTPGAWSWQRGLEYLPPVACIELRAGCRKPLLAVMARTGAFGLRHQRASWHALCNVRPEADGTRHAIRCRGRKKS
jgi:flagellar FliJ protein